MVTPHVATDIVIESSDSCNATISMYPFASGYAITLAHPIRRLIMSSTAGFSPVAVKIEGAKYEFDNIVGMIEDISVFIINLKSIRFKLKDNTKEEDVISYHFTGKKDLIGKDLTNDKVEITSPEQHLATLNNDGDLNFSVIVKKGMSYVPSEYFKDDLPEGYIPIDAFFSPVKKAVYKIDKMLVNDDPSFEKIIFDIQTDGQIDPIDAFKNAVTNMNAQMSVFRQIVNIDNSIPDKPKVEKDTRDIKDLLVRIEDLNLSARSFNSLDKNNIQYIGQIVLMSSVELRGVRNLGKKSYEEILDKVKEYNFTLSYQLSEERQKLFDEEVEKIQKNKL
jgi:DNA-directed RNA polymerase subunit alpha